MPSEREIRLTQQVVSRMRSQTAAAAPTDQLLSGGMGADEPDDVYFETAPHISGKPVEVAGFDEGVIRKYQPIIQPPVESTPKEKAKGKKKEA